jgi:hypothetical protein
MRSRSLLFAVLCWFTCIAAVATAAAQNPFVGTWKLNQEKSQMAGDTLKFRPAEGEAIEVTAGGVTYSFRTDGKTYGMPSGDVAIWRQSNANGWTTEYRKIDGKLLSIDTWKLSGDGKQLSLTSSGAKADGDLYTNTAEYERTAGSSGLIGSWKSTEVKLSAPDDFVIQESGLDKLVVKIAAQKASLTAALDGKEVPVEGPDIPAGLRVSLTRTGPYAFRMVEKLNGDVVWTTQYTVAEDRKTMTEVGNAPGDPPQTMIWEKQ